ncbi:ABC-F family ATP-binding cassette domain-containing protein [Rhodovibrionaceae bacterium A322]
MTLLSLKDAGYIAQDYLFQNLTLTLNSGDRIGLVAQNGAGKSTLLRCLAGDLDLSSGELFRSRGLHIGFMAQAVAPDLLDKSLRQAVLTALPEDQQESESWRVDMVLDSFDAPPELHDTKVSDLSGGWQRLMLLARVWVTDPDVLLMDEPTNHLDLEKILLLENWLNTWIGQVPVLVASHDRSFLDQVTNRTLFLRPRQSLQFPLPYSPAKAELANVDSSQEREQERQLKEAGQLRRQSAKLKNIGLNSGSDLLQKKQKQLRERAEKIEETLNDLHKERSGEIRLANRGTHAKALVRIENLTLSTPDGRLLFKIEKLDLFQGDRIVLLGRNGVGKTTLVRLLHRCLIAGEEIVGIKATPSLVTGYLDQALSDIPLDKSPFDVISRYDISDARSRAALASAGIAFDWQRRPISTLSLGQRSRLALLALRFTEPNFYLLDEPTNHIDIAGQEALAGEIKAKQASCVLVSHDRSFVREVGTRFLSIEQKKLSESDSPDRYFASLSL